MKFHHICTLISSFCWKYIKFQLKKYRRVISHDIEEWCKIWRKIDLLFKKWQEFGELWSEHSKVSKICSLIGPFGAKYLTFDLKSTDELSLMTLKCHAKFEKKLTCSLENDMRNFANFQYNTWKCQDWDFDGWFSPK